MSRHHLAGPAASIVPGVGLDVAPHAPLLWLTEVRAFQSEDCVFPERDAADALASRSVVVVTSLALTF